MGPKPKRGRATAPKSKASTSKKYQRHPLPALVMPKWPEEYVSNRTKLSAAYRKHLKRVAVIRAVTNGKMTIRQGRTALKKLTDENTPGPAPLRGASVLRSRSPSRGKSMSPEDAGHQNDGPDGGDPESNDNPRKTSPRRSLDRKVGRETFKSPKSEAQDDILRSPSQARGLSTEDGPTEGTAEDVTADKSLDSGSNTNSTPVASHAAVDAKEEDESANGSNEGHATHDGSEDTHDKRSASPPSMTPAATHPLPSPRRNAPGHSVRAASDSPSARAAPERSVRAASGSPSSRATPDRSIRAGSGSPSARAERAARRAASAPLMEGNNRIKKAADGSARSTREGRASARQKRSTQLREMLRDRDYEPSSPSSAGPDSPQSAGSAEALLSTQGSMHKRNARTGPAVCDPVFLPAPDSSDSDEGYSATEAPSIKHRRGRSEPLKKSRRMGKDRSATPADKTAAGAASSPSDVVDQPLLNRLRTTRARLTRLRGQ